MIARSRCVGLAVVTSLLLLGTAACSGGGSTAESGNGEGAPVALRFAGWGQEQAAAMQVVIDAFQADHPGVTVTYENIPFAEYATKMQVQASAGDAPDVLWVAAANNILYASEGVTANLDDLVEESGFDLSAYSKPSLEQVSWDGSLYGFPRGAATTQVWYNKELFDAAGVEYPRADWTWEDMKRAAEQLTDPANGVWGVAAALDATQSYLNTIPAAGGQVLTEDGSASGFDDPQTCQGISFWTDLIESGVMPTYSQQLEVPPDSLFQAGKAAMMWAGSWFPGIFAANAELADKIDVAPLPEGPAGRATLLTSNAYAMSANTEHPDEAWAFLSFLASPEGAGLQAQSANVVQPAEQAAAEVWAEQFPQWDMDVILDSPSYGVPHPQSKLTEEWLTDMKDSLIPAFNLEASPDQVCATVDEQIEDVLAKEGDQ